MASELLLRARRAKLQDVAEIQTGGTPSKGIKEYWQGDIPWVSPKDMHEERIVDTEDHVTLEAVENSTTKLVTVGTLLVTVRSGILARAVPIAIVATPVTFNQDIKAISPDPDSVDSRYLARGLQSLEPVILTHGVKKGATVQSIRSGFLESLEIPLPLLSQQRRIAAVLDEQMAAVEEAREAVEAQLEATEELTAAYLSEVFERKEAKEWPEGSLGKLINEKGQYGISVKSHEEPVGVPMLRMLNIEDGQLAWGKLKYVELDKNDWEKYHLRYGDVLFNRTNSAELAGKKAVFDNSRDAVFASYLIRFVTRDDVLDPFFLSICINSSYGKRYIRKQMGRAIGQVNISATKMRKMPVPLPLLISSTHL